mgnify:CR=1 FL=1
MEFAPITREDLPELVRLYQEYLNGGDYIGREAERAFDSGLYFGVKAARDGRVAGLLGFRQELELTYPHPELERELLEILGERRYCSVDCLLVLPDYRRQGLAHELAAHAREELRRHRIDTVQAEIWIYPTGECPAKAPLEALGKVFWQRREERFYPKLKDYGMTCPLCGETCRCGAWIDLIDVSGNDDEKGEESHV